MSGFAGCSLDTAGTRGSAQGNQGYRKGLTGVGRPTARSIEASADSLAAFPDRGRVVPELGLPRRELIVENFRLVYWTRGNAVEILRLIHGKQDFLRAWRQRGGGVG